MKLEDETQAPDSLFRQHPALKKLERQLFAHVRALGDLRMLLGLETVLYCVLTDILAEDLAGDLSRMLVTHAVERVIHDPWRNSTSVPHGISRTERFAAFFEQGCPFCEAKVGLVVEPEPDDDCACCDMLVREWRAKHADALRQFGRAWPQ